MVKIPASVANKSIYIYYISFHNRTIILACVYKLNIYIFVDGECLGVILSSFVVVAIEELRIIACLLLFAIARKNNIVLVFYAGTKLDCEITLVYNYCSFRDSLLTAPTTDKAVR